MLFGAFPIVYRLGRGWNEGVSGLPFVGVAIGMLAAVAYTIFYDNNRYLKCIKKSPNGFAQPEDRLPPAIVGGILLPIGLFWFAWTNSPSLPWQASVAAAIPFGFGMVLIFLSIMNYLIDAYTIFAASVLAANGIIRSLFGAAFPLFTSQMYNGLGKTHFERNHLDGANIPQASTGLPRFPHSLLSLAYHSLFYSTSMVHLSARSASTPHKPMLSWRNSVDKLLIRLLLNPVPLLAQRRSRPKKTRSKKLLTTRSKMKPSPSSRK